jgi:type IV pilus assembly protein PilA
MPLKQIMADCSQQNAGNITTCDSWAELTTDSPQYTALPTLKYPETPAVALTATTGAIIVRGNLSVGSCVVTWTPTVTPNAITWAGVTSGAGCNKSKTGV